MEQLLTSDRVSSNCMQERKFPCMWLHITAVTHKQCCRQASGWCALPQGAAAAPDCRATLLRKWFRSCLHILLPQLHVSDEFPLAVVNCICKLLCACVATAEAVLRPVFNELCFNLESFNPAFAACLLQVRGSSSG
jgi:hypothetical protein